MHDSFKITANELKRYLKIGVLLPNTYSINEEKYPLVIVFEGDLFFNFIAEKTKRYDTDLICQNQNVIFLGLHSPTNPLWRTSELNPFYNGDNPEIDSSLARIYFDYIEFTLIPLLKEKYRFTNIYTLGIQEGAIASLYMSVHSDLIKGSILINPKLDNVEYKNLKNDLNSMDKNTPIFLYQGEISHNSNIKELYLDLNSSTNSIEYIESDDYNTFDNIELAIKKGLSFIQDIED